MFHTEWALLPSALQSRDTRERSQQCAVARDDLTASPVHTGDISSGTSQLADPLPALLHSPRPTITPSLFLPWWVGLHVKLKERTFSSFCTESLLIMTSLKNRRFKKKTRANLNE